MSFFNTGEREWGRGEPAKGGHAFRCARARAQRGRPQRGRNAAFAESKYIMMAIYQVAIYGLVAAVVGGSGGED